MIRVLIVDDHQLFRQGLYAILGTAKDIEIVGEARDGQEAIEAAERLRPHVTLMDIEMPRMDGLEATRQLLAKRLSGQVLMLTMRTREQDVRQAAKSGARGYLIKNCSREELTNGIRTVHAGGTACSPEIAPYFSKNGS